jgi:hypothetical protein
MLRQVRYEQYWPWELLANHDIDLTAIVCPRACLTFTGALQQRNAEIEYLVEQGYRPQISVIDSIESCYTTVIYEFAIPPEDLTMLVLRFPNPSQSCPV